MDYTLSKDLVKFRELKGYTQEDLSNETGISRVTIARAEKDRYQPSLPTLEMFYSYVYDTGLKINSIDSAFLEDNKGNNQLFFHGSKSEIIGQINTQHSLEFKDFGKAFYLGESYLNAASWVVNKKGSCVYAIYFDNDSNLKNYELKVGKEWMIAILAFRGSIDSYINHPEVKKVIDKIKSCDYIIAPIADNTMYDILEEFASKEITDEQCLHCLSANQLGKQIVFLNDDACKHLKIVKRFYLSNSERVDIKKIRESNNEIGYQKVLLAKQEYRRKGKYIDELFK